LEELQNNQEHARQLYQEIIRKHRHMAKAIGNSCSPFPFLEFEAHAQSIRRGIVFRFIYVVACWHPVGGKN